RCGARGRVRPTTTTTRSTDLSVSRPTLLVCTRCERGDKLYARVRRLRKLRGLKQTFKLDEARCLDLCDAPCAIQLEGKNRSTVARTSLVPEDAEAVVDAAVAYAGLAPGDEIPSRALPGEHAD